MSWVLAGVVLASCLFSGIICPPVTTPPPSTGVPVQDDVVFGLEYERYLKEVVSVLETDEAFKKKLEESNVTDIKTGEIARHLEFVSHNIRTKLDELKRRELDRLRQLVRIKMRHAKGMKNFDPMRLMKHLDHSNPHSFEADDLANLIKQATQDLEDIDSQRRQDFKTYEMEKEHQRREKLKMMDERKQAEEERQWQEQQKKHKDHPKLKHPGSRDQLEEVWSENDGYEKDQFDPKTFFQLHDVNGDGFLDEEEVEALFQNELNKVYDPNAPEDDMIERYEEMNRMREHVINEIDKNQDKLISWPEFFESTKTSEFEKDDGWKTLDEEDLFTDEELAAFEQEYERQRAEAFLGQQQPGVINHPQDPSQPPPIQDVYQMDQRGQVPPVPQFVPPNQPQQQQQFQQQQQQQFQQQQFQQPEQFQQQQQQFQQPPPVQQQQQQQQQPPAEPQQQQQQPPQHQQQQQEQQPEALKFKPQV